MAISASHANIVIWAAGYTVWNVLWKKEASEAATVQITAQVNHRSLMSRIRFNVRSAPDIAMNRRSKGLDLTFFVTALEKNAYEV